MHLLQADIKSIPEQAARIAEMANSNTDNAMTTLLSEIRASNEKHAEHAAAFQQLTSRLDKLSVTPVDDRQHTTVRRSRSPSPRHVRFEERQPRRSSHIPRLNTGYDRRRPPSNFRRSPTSNSTCYRCGRSHPYCLSLIHISEPTRPY